MINYNYGITSTIPTRSTFKLILPDLPCLSNNLGGGGLPLPLLSSHTVRIVINEKFWFSQESTAQWKLHQEIVVFFRSIMKRNGTHHVQPWTMDINFGVQPQTITIEIRNGEIANPLRVSDIIQYIYCVFTRVEPHRCEIFLFTLMDNLNK
jgi:hypothetical protein